METSIRQRQLIMSPLMPSHGIGENEPLTAIFNKVIAAKEVNHKGQGEQQGGAWDRAAALGLQRGRDGL